MSEDVKKKKKKKRNNKRKIILEITLAVLVQLIILMASSSMISRTFPIPPDRIKTASIVVEDKDYSAYKEPHLILSSGGKQYVFWNYRGPNEYSSPQLRDMISVGDCLIVQYTEDRTIILGKYYKVLGARTESQVYRTVEGNNKIREENRIPWCVICGILELLYLLAIIFRIREKKFYRKYIHRS